MAREKVDGDEDDCPRAASPCPFLLAMQKGASDLSIADDWISPHGATFQAVHGERGVLPLRRDDDDDGGDDDGDDAFYDAIESAAAPATPTPRARCPLRGLFATTSTPRSRSGDEEEDEAAAPARSDAWSFRGALARRVASISFSALGRVGGGGGGGGWRKPSGGGGGNGDDARASKKTADGGSSASAKNNAPPASKSSTASTSAASASVEASVKSFAASKCPFAKVPGFDALVKSMLTAAERPFKCPAPIVAMRAAVAALPQVKRLRPEPLQSKLLAVAATAAFVNAPLGALREHTEKFSFQWFVAIHASIPFVASLRKAVGMPKLAILFTVAAAVMGQYAGSRGERARLRLFAAAGKENQNKNQNIRNPNRDASAERRRAKKRGAPEDDAPPPLGGRASSRRVRVGGGGDVSGGAPSRGGGLPGLPKLRGLGSPVLASATAAAAAAAGDDAAPRRRVAVR